ncbi:unnamed protein product, partial [Rotaria socialis]
MTRCSFDIHVQEILGTLLVGGTLIMLHPGGTIDFDYLSEFFEHAEKLWRDACVQNCYSRTNQYPLVDSAA